MNKNTSLLFEKLVKRYKISRGKKSGSTYRGYIEIKEEKKMECIMIGIAGGTGSGKSTFTNRLKNRF